jgi:hypothetical protein
MQPVKSIMTTSDPGTSDRVKKTKPISKIALLSSFFERKARLAAGEKEPKFSISLLRGRHQRRPDL